MTCWTRRPGGHGAEVVSVARDRAFLKVRDLVVQFNSPDGIVHAVNGVSFDLFKGECLGIVGESGSGKSVSMMSLLGLLPQPPAVIAGGEAILSTSSGDIDLLRLSERELRRARGGQIGFVFQDPLSSLNPVMTVGKQIAESMKAHRDIGKDTARRETIKLLDAVGIGDAENRYDRYPHQFSGGMRQRVMIAIALAADPPIVIFDEPTTALDVTVQAQIVQMVKQDLLVGRGTAVIWITHDLAVVAGIADRVAVMYGGTIVEVGLVDDIYEHPQHPYTLGLLHAVPSLEDTGEERLKSIEGTPPNLLTELAQCPFTPRCPYALEACTATKPKPVAVNESQSVACFYDVDAQRPRDIA